MQAARNAVFLALSWLLLATATALPARSDSAVLKIATEGTYTPMSFFDRSGKLVGFEVELVRAVCERAEWRCTFEILQFDGMIAALQEGKVDALAAGMRMTEQRRKIVDFSEKYYTTYARFVSCTDPVPQRTGPTDLGGRVIGTQSSTSNAAYLQQYYSALSPIRLYKSTDDAFLDLRAGRLDLVLSSELVAHGFLGSPNGVACRYAGDRVVDPSFRGEVGLVLRKGSEAIREKFNKALASIIADGTYAALNARYFPFSVY